MLPYKFCCTSNHCCHCYSVITANISSFFIEVLFRGGSVNHRFDSWKNDHVVRRDSPLINKVEDKWKHLTSIINSLSWSLKWCYSFLIFLLIKFLKDYYDRKSHSLSSLFLFVIPCAGWYANAFRLTEHALRKRSDCYVTYNKQMRISLAFRLVHLLS